MFNNTYNKISQYTHALLVGVVLVFILVPLTVAFVMHKISPVEASTNDNLTGYAWVGTKGSGWIRMSNCDDPDDTATCDPVDYGVNIDANGNWSGKGWSNNFGWVDFGGHSSCPDSGVGVQTQLVTGVTTGFAYVESYTGSSLGENGGVGGCINMGGGGGNVPNNGGVTLDWVTGDIDGYAWSGYDVQADLDGDGSYDAPYDTLDGTPDVGLGWIDFSGVTYHVPTENPHVTITSFPQYICPDDPAQNIEFDIDNYNTVELSDNAFDQSAIASQLGVSSIPWPFSWTTSTLTSSTGSSFPLMQHNGSSSVYGLTATITASNDITGSIDDVETVDITYLPASDARCDGIDATGEICGNGIDDNGNGVIDEGCDICNDDYDNDGDGLIDGQDADECPLVIPIFEEI